MKRNLILTAMLLSAVLAQAHNITIKAVSRPADKVFAEVMRQSGGNYVYKPEILKGIKITINVTDQPLETVLKKMFSGTGIEYTVKGGLVTLRKTGKAKKPVAMRSVSGFVREKESGEPVAGATVMAMDCNKAVTSNASGFFTLSLPAGRTSISVSCFGYNNGSPEMIGETGDITVDLFLDKARELEEVVVVASHEDRHAFQSADIGSSTISIGKIKSTPVVFGESDVIKTLQLDPGVSAGIEGLAGMYVHGGNTDENLYMLDNIPLYQVNHLGGLFSAFNTEVMRNVDFHKSTFPAKYDGRLSSFMDVHTKDGRTDGHHGSFSLGLTSGNFCIDGPIGNGGKTSYSFGIRRSWLDLVTIPALAIINACSKIDHYRFGYAFSDINAKITHRFSPRSKAWLSVYYGEDYLNGGTKWDPSSVYDIKEDSWQKLKWGNIVASAGWNYVVSPSLFAEFNAAYTRYFSRLKSDENSWEIQNRETTSEMHNLRVTNNNINDWIMRASFDWHPSESHHIEFGAGLTFHSFLPSRSIQRISSPGFESVSREDGAVYNAVETNAYIGDDWVFSDMFRLNAGVHASLFHIGDATHGGVSPRFSMSFNPSPAWAVKASYSHAVQYVHQLSQSFISLPTDQWVPITGKFKPQTSDKISIGGYHRINDNLTVSLEGYYKWMHNLIDYREQYYLISPLQSWDALLTSGDGSSKGIDLKISKNTGNLTGHISYSLMWADRRFPLQNNGKSYPARFDNRHKINILCAWKINPTWEINASWTSMSGNRFTLPTQMWQGPGIHDSFYSEGWGETQVSGYDPVPLITSINNYRLPFYHRLDLGIVRHTRKGFWTISLYNAYCHQNVISIRRGVNENSFRPVFQKLSILPIIPSFSYTWQF